MHDGFVGEFERDHFFPDTARLDDAQSPENADSQVVRGTVTGTLKGFFPGRGQESWGTV